MNLTKFKDALPIPPVINPLKRERDFTYYEIKIKEGAQVLHSELPPTTIWGFEGIYPGPTIEVETNEQVFVKWMNELPPRHLFPIDHTVHGAEVEKPDVRTVVHLHGGRTEPESDGYPEAWFTNGYAQTGPFFKKKIYSYQNRQSSRTLWYHDHAIGLTSRTGLLNTGIPIPYDPRERGWKDTVTCPPGQITSVIIPFFPFTGLYVWHCHMLEHEDYEMMRPYVVLPFT